MGRLLLLVIVVVLAVWLIRRALSGSASRGKPPPPPQGEGELVTCAHCGVPLPRSEARPSGEAHYCSEEHARLGPGEPK